MAGFSAKAETLLNEDAFKNEHSQKLFQAIDELRNHGAHHEIELPEVSVLQAHQDFPQILIGLVSSSLWEINPPESRHYYKASQTSPSLLQIDCVPGFQPVLSLEEHLLSPSRSRFR